ncbi:hypothetical protein J2S70_000425 [Trueperella bonasi]|uniref:Uncharacterized protein n=1 Tax=Trueperella bonasi TaxID=312286 RepID=A0ABT9NFM4_9ACTO|nr:hypothetical protein [Trueperella bonasi]MDP9805843.1 hypothetical protein [Trueperella bonasi]
MVLLVDEIILRTFVKSLLVTLPIAFCCTLIAFPLTIFGRVFHKKIATILIFSSVAFLLLPAPAITLILFNWIAPYSFDAYVSTVAFACFPIAFVTQYIVFNVSAHQLVAASQTHHSIVHSLTKLYPDQLRRALVAPTISTGVLITFDPGIAMTTGTTQPAFGRAVLDSLSYYAPLHERTNILILSAFASLWMVTAHARHASSGLHGFGARPRMKRWRIVPRPEFAALCYILSAVILALYFLVSGHLFGRALPLFPHSAHAPLVVTLLSSLFIITVSLLLASIVATWSYWFKVKHRPALIWLHMWLAGIGLTCGGLVVDSVSRTLGRFGLPPLSGGAGVAGGAIAIVLSQFLVAYPVLFLLITYLLRRNAPIIASAYDAGASRARVFFSLFSHISRSHWLIAWATLVAFFMTHAAPIIFVSSPIWPQLGPTIALAASQGAIDRLITFSMTGFITSTSFIGLSAFAFTRLTKGGYDARA